MHVEICRQPRKWSQEGGNLEMLEFNCNFAYVYCLSAQYAVLNDSTGDLRDHGSFPCCIICHTWARDLISYFIILSLSSSIRQELGKTSDWKTLNCKHF